MTWNDISLKQYNELIKVDTTQDPIDYAADVIRIVFDIDDPLSLSIQEFNKYSEMIKFIGNKVPDVKLKDIYKVNNREYVLDGNVFEWSMSQLIDFRKYSATTNLSDIVSCYIIPKGHKYNDGYEMEEVIKDINCLPVPDILKMQSFFVQGAWMSINIMVDYLQSQLKTTKAPNIQEKIETLKALISELQTNTTSYLTSLHTAK